MKVALVSDPLTVYGGAERVIEQILQLYPDADLFSVVDTVPAETRAFLAGKHVDTSFIQRLPSGARRYQALFPLWALAIEQFDLSRYDLILSSHHSVAWGALTRPGQVHVCYVHSPMRYAWDRQNDYLREAGLERGPRSWLARWVLHRARLWDFAASRRPDMLLANSQFVASRLRRFHGLTSRVIHPPVAVRELPRDAAFGQDRGYYLSVGRLVPYKRVELLARAFAGMPERRLKIVGTGPDFARIAQLKAPNVELLGSLPTSELRTLMAGATAFLFAGVEDFGIAAVEAQACGTPVIAFRAGGMTETVVPPPHPRATGLLFDGQNEDGIRDAVQRFEAGKRPLPMHCRANAERFSEARFRAAYQSAVQEALAAGGARYAVSGAA